MRFNIFFCLSFLTFLATFSTSSARLSRRRVDLSDLSELSARNEASLGAEASFEIVFRRAKISAAASAARKATARATANKNGKGAKPVTNAAKRTNTQAAANTRKAAKKQAGRNKYGAAAAAHKATTNLPGRKQQFKVPHGGPSFSGKQVRKAVFNSHMERHANKGKSKTQLKKSPLKDFGNSPHRQQNKPHDKKSINHMKGRGHEYPLGDPKNKGPARVITQQTKQGHTKFKGVVAHDVRRPAGSHGYNDHFQVKPTGSKKSRK